MVRPDRKVTIGGVVGSAVTICAWLVHEIWAFHIPPGVEGAFVVLLTFIVSYWVNDGNTKQGQRMDSGRNYRGSDIRKMDDNEVKE